MDCSALPAAATAAPWREDQPFSAADELLIDPEFKTLWLHSLSGYTIVSKSG
jgi:hypothetical protein